MQVVLACALSLVAVAVAAPYNNGMFLRRPRSHGFGGYISPCASAGAIHAIPSYHQPSAYQLGPVQGYGAPHYGGYGGPHYRADEFEENTGDEAETMNFSETEPAENAPMARYVSLGGGGYGAAAGGYGAGIAGYSGHALAPIVPAASPGAVGVFPGANVRGCNVPLLLSCSPNIVAGHLVKSQYGSHYAPSYGAGPAVVAGAGAYREDEAHPDLAQGEHSDHAEHTTTVHEAAAATPDANRTQ